MTQQRFPEHAGRTMLGDVLAELEAVKRDLAEARGRVGTLETEAASMRARLDTLELERVQPLEVAVPDHESRIKALEGV